MPRLVLLLVVACMTCAAHAVDVPKRVKYVAPEGFGAHKWGDLRTSFERLPEAPIGVGAAWITPMEKESGFTCILNDRLPGTISGAVPTCDFQATLLRLRKQYEGGGFYVLSEYAIDGQGFRFGDADPVVLHPVVYQFCANWYDTRREPPPKFDEMNKFCGVKLLFESETREQLRGQPANHVTNYDRVFDKLLARFGRPDGFERRGRVTVETLEGESTGAADRKFRIWRWCPARDKGFHTSCAASVVLALDPATGVGTVFYSTPLLWEFAYARQNNGYKGDPLFRVLHGREPPQNRP